MPVVTATNLPAAPPAGGVQFAASAPSELFWLLLYLAHDAKHSPLHGARLAEEHPELARRVTAFWRDPGEGFTELFVLGQRGGTLYELEPARFIEGLDDAAAAPDAPLGLESEQPSEIEAVRRRLAVLRDDAAVRDHYRALLTDAWAIVADEWERQGRAQVQASIAEWPGRLERAGSLPNALPSRHILRRYLPMVEAAEARGEVVVTPLYLAGVGHLIKLPGVLLLGAGLRDGDHLAKRRAEAEALAQKLKLLADPTRVLIIALLTNSSLSVGDLVEELKLSQPTISVHVRQLREAGLLEVRRDGGRTLYSTSTQRVEALLDEARSVLRTICEW